MRRSIIAPVVLVMMFILGCSKGSSDYTIDAAPVTLAKAGKAEVVFSPGAGYKWNAEFPAKLTVVDKGGLTVEQTAYSREDFIVDGDSAKVSIELSGENSGKTNLKMTANFSVCTDEVCRIFREIPIEIAVTVQ
ncbi:MAG TPA: hypothetical protein PK329_00805 [Myxococcota bacterium]|jgi:hypothetical protein|nr:hypothetical protein [Myxococcota bacterium]HOS60971.1 hypothetical protein [Myxococcota bacterium]HPC91180.1 hypothetical protein [Myxococcota bacterium]HPL24115.1 hypothetical protein [Myxococcota bacterium]HQE72974.1 hypothetical protein [Myxococcota bacterium]